MLQPDCQSDCRHRQRNKIDLGSRSMRRAPSLAGRYSHDTINGSPQWSQAVLPWALSYCWVERPGGSSTTRRIDLRRWCDNHVP